MNKNRRSYKKLWLGLTCVIGLQTGWSFKERTDETLDAIQTVPQPGK